VGTPRTRLESRKETPSIDCTDSTVAPGILVQHQGPGHQALCARNDERDEKQNCRKAGDQGQIAEIQMQHRACRPVALRRIRGEGASEALILNVAPALPPRPRPEALSSALPAPRWAPLTHLSAATAGCDSYLCIAANGCCHLCRRSTRTTFTAARQIESALETSYHDAPAVTLNAKARPCPRSLRARSYLHATPNCASLPPKRRARRSASLQSQGT